MHIRLTSHGGQRVRGAASRPDGCCRTSLRVACARLALEWLLVPTLAAGLCLPAAVCCCALPSAAFSVARGEAVRARRARAGGGGARPRTEVRRGAAPPRDAIGDVAPAAAALGGEAAAPLPHATAETVSSLPHTAPSPPDVAAPRRHTHAPLTFDAVSPDARVRRGRALLGWGVALSASCDSAGAASALAAAPAARPGHAQTLVALATVLRARAAGRGGEALGGAGGDAPRHRAGGHEGGGKGGGGAMQWAQVGQVLTICE